MTHALDTKDRCFGRLKARELTSQEIENVSGGLSITRIDNSTMFQFLDTDGDGNADALRYENADIIN